MALVPLAVLRDDWKLPSRASSRASPKDDSMAVVSLVLLRACPKADSLVAVPLVSSMAGSMASSRAYSRAYPKADSMAAMSLVLLRAGSMAYPKADSLAAVPLVDSMAGSMTSSRAYSKAVLMVIRREVQKVGLKLLPRADWMAVPLFFYIRELQRKEVRFPL
jgi:hypothetical protein